VKDQTSASVGDSAASEAPETPVADPTPQAQPDPTPVAEPEEDLGNDPILEVDAPEYRVTLVRRLTVEAQNIDDETYDHTALDLSDEGPVSVSLGALDRTEKRDYLDEDGRITLGDKPIIVDADAAALLIGLPFAKVEVAD
jgi:hypothetical protein